MPDIVTLKMIAEKCDVSADWLLGSTDISNSNIKKRDICQKLGLSPDTVDALRRFANSNTLHHSFIARFLRMFLFGKKPISNILVRILCLPPMLQR